MGKMYWKRWGSWWEIDTDEDFREFISWSMADYAARIVMTIIGLIILICILPI